LQFKNAGEISNYKRELDILNAIAATSYSVNGIDYKKRIFNQSAESGNDNNLTASQKNNINFEASIKQSA